MKIIEIVVAPNGETKVETKGFVGNQCQKASRFLNKALGDTSTEQLKPEFHVQVDHQGTIDHTA